MRQIIRRFIASERATTAIEYGLIASLLAVAVLLGAQAIGGSLSGVFNDVEVGVGTGAAAP